MLNARRHQTKAALALAVGAAAVIATLMLSIQSAPAHAVDLGHLQQRISAGQSQMKDLAGQVQASSGQIDHLNSSIASQTRQLTRIQDELSAKLAELHKIQGQLHAARARLAQLEAFEAHAESVLAKQLLSTYESDQPDLVTVVLESTGFQDLLERLQFANRIQHQDVRIVGEVRAARRAVAAEAVHLGSLEVRQQKLTDQILGERNTLARAWEALLGQRKSVATRRAVEAGRLASVRSQVSGLENQVAQIEAAQAAAQAQQQGQQAPQSSAGSFGAPSVSSGGFVFPLPKSAASPPDTWSPDQGVDISAPGDTPEYAVCSGTIVLHGIGGFGPWAPVLHCDSAIDGYSYVYYGHAGPENQLPVGTHVGAGQVMSSVGPGIVGISTGPHLEIGFADSSGSPIGSQTAGTMLALLQGAY